MGNHSVFISMNQELVFLLILFIFFFSADTQSQSTPSPPPVKVDAVSSFRPSVAIVIGILSIMFSLTFLLLIYAKFCHTTTSDFLQLNNPNLNGLDGLVGPRARFSGIDKTVIESLPFFKFSSLKGSKEGLECVVCLSKFEETEILRLLPKCKHAFHINCVDQWLEKHSSCPLCRNKVDPKDINMFTYSTSMRFSQIQSRTHSDLSEDPTLELFVKREQDDRGSSRFRVGSSFRMMIDKEGVIPSGKLGTKDNDEFKHETVVSDVVFKNRWSDASPSDLISLNSEMLIAASATRFSPHSHSYLPDNMPENIKEDIERRRYFETKVSRLDRSYSGPGSANIPSTSEVIRADNSRLILPSGKRSMSDITKLSRFGVNGGRNRIKEASSDGNGVGEERVRRLWFPIARRTVEWIAGREQRSKHSQYSAHASLV